MKVLGPVRIAVVDDHNVVLRGVKALAEEAESKVAVVVAVRTTVDLFEALDRIPVDVVLLDLYLNDGSDPEHTLQELADRGVPALIHTSELRPVPIRRAIRAGARGLVLKADPDESLLGAVAEVMTGEFAVSSELAYVLVTDPDLAIRVAPRELEALQLFAEGVPKKAIGRRMRPEVAAATVTTYFSRITERYAQVGREVGNAMGVVREAHLDGHLDLGGPPSGTPGPRSAKDDGS